MTNLLPRFPENVAQHAKSFWKRPEGKVGAAVLVSALAGLVFFGAPYLIALFATLSTLFSAAIAATVYGSVLALLVLILSNRRVHTLLKILFQRGMRWLTGIFIELDPIGIMRSYITDLHKKENVISDSINALNGQYGSCTTQIEKNQSIYENEMSKAKLAKENGQTTAATIAARQAVRLSDLNEKRLKPLAAQMQAHLKMLRKYREVSTIIRTDLENEISIQEQQRDMITTSHGAIAAAKRIIQGGHDERAMYDQAIEYLASDYQMKLGTIEGFLESSRSFMDSMDLQNGVYEQEAMKRLAEWEAQADALLEQSVAHTVALGHDISGLELMKVSDKNKVKA